MEPACALPQLAFLPKTLSLLPVAVRSHTPTSRTASLQPAPASPSRVPPAIACENRKNCRVSLSALAGWLVRYRNGSQPQKKNALETTYRTPPGESRSRAVLRASIPSCAWLARRSGHRTAPSGQPGQPCHAHPYALKTGPVRLRLPDARQQERTEAHTRRTSSRSRARREAFRNASRLDRRSPELPEGTCPPSSTSSTFQSLLPERRQRPPADWILKPGQVREGHRRDSCHGLTRGSEPHLAPCSAASKLVFPEERLGNRAVPYERRIRPDGVGVFKNE